MNIQSSTYTTTHPIKTRTQQPFPLYAKIGVLKWSKDPNIFAQAIANKLTEKGIPTDAIVWMDYTLFNPVNNTFAGMPLKAWLKRNHICGYVGGGNKYDIPPAVYGKHIEKNLSLPPAEDLRFIFEGHLFECLYEKAIPALLICGSMQRFAIACGYTMVQNLPEKTQTPHNPLGACSTANTALSPEDLFDKVKENTHPVITKPGSIIHALEGPEWHLSSFHSHSVSTQRNPIYQEVFQKPPIPLKLSVTAIESAGDETVNEVFEASLHQQFVFGIQGHPEVMESEKTFDTFISAACLYRRSQWRHGGNRFNLSADTHQISGIKEHVARMEAARISSNQKTKVPLKKTNSWEAQIAEHRKQILLEHVKLSLQNRVSAHPSSREEKVAMSPRKGK